MQQGCVVKPRRLEFRNSRGQKLVGLLCEKADAVPRAIVVIPPGYERKIRHYAVISAYLVEHGYATIRFDFSNHVGLSDGDISDLTLTSMADDIGAAMDYARQLFPALPLLMVAPSLSARATVRGAQGRRLNGMVLLLPVMDVKATLCRVVGADIIQGWLDGKVADANALVRVVEHDIKYTFGADASKNDWWSPEGTQSEIAQIHAPVCAIAAEVDDWVLSSEVQDGMSRYSQFARDCLVIESSSHDITHNPPSFRALMESMMHALDRALDVDHCTVQHLEFEQIVSNGTEERLWAKNEYLFEAAN